MPLGRTLPPAPGRAPERDNDRLFAEEEDAAEAAAAFVAYRVKKEVGEVREVDRENVKKTQFDLGNFKLTILFIMSSEDLAAEQDAREGIDAADLKVSLNFES